MSTRTTDVWVYSGPGWGDALDITGYKVEALDGSIGKVNRATYQTNGSYIVVDTGPWIFGKKVVLPAGVLRQHRPRRGDGVRPPHEGRDQGLAGIRRHSLRRGVPQRSRHVLRPRRPRLPGALGPVVQQRIAPSSPASGGSMAEAGRRVLATLNPQLRLRANAQDPDPPRECLWPGAAGGLRPTCSQVGPTMMCIPQVSSLWVTQTQGSRSASTSRSCQPTSRTARRPRPRSDWRRAKVGGENGVPDPCRLGT